MQASQASTYGAFLYRSSAAPATAACIMATVALTNATRVLEDLRMRQTFSAAAGSGAVHQVVLSPMQAAGLHAQSNTTFFHRLPPNSLCCSGLAGARLIARASRPCGCEAACLASKKCDFFSFFGARGECRSCRLLSNCNASALLDGDNIRDLRLLSSHMLASTWSKRRPKQANAQRHSLFKASSSILRDKACPDFLSPSTWKARPDPMSAAPKTNQMSHFIGSNRRASEREALDGPICNAAHDRARGAPHQTEEQIFRSACSARITELDGHLLRTRARQRALIIESPGRSQCELHALEIRSFHCVTSPRVAVSHPPTTRHLSTSLLVRRLLAGGWGNVLPFAYALHLLCLRAERYCYLALQDQDFGDRLGYANGERWQADPASIHQQFDGTSKVMINLSYAAWSYLPCWRHGATHNSDAQPANLARSKHLSWCKKRLVDPHAALDLDALATRLKLETASLVHMTLAHPFEAYHTFESWFGYDLPLHAADGRLDRCFCRYVTQPLFMSQLPAPLRAAIRRIEARPPSVVLHLRTMANHLPSPIRTSPACDRDGAHSLHATDDHVPGSERWRRWFFAACDERAFHESRDRVFVMSDSPRLLMNLRQGFRRRVVINPMLLNDTVVAHQQRQVDEDAAPYFAMIEPSTEGGRGAAAKRARHRHRLQWERTQQLLALDVHLASLAQEIQTDQESSFALPLMARSMCLRRVRYLAEAAKPRQGGGSLCPNWTTTFPRTLPYLLYRQPWQFHTCFERPAANGHPCKGLSPEECHASFIAAV